MFRLTALVDLYNATHGVQWESQDNWKVPGTHVCDWYGVTCNSDSTAVIALELPENNLTGDMPESIGNLTNLTGLDLQDNSLTGPIPESIGNLTNLTELSLWINSLTGPIPESIGDLTNLTSLDLGWNSLTGPIPESVGKLTNLTYLYLDRNSLTGPIPEPIGNLTKLDGLYLDSNNLSGVIPTTITSLTYLVSGELTLYENCNLTAPNQNVIDFINSKGNGGYQKILDTNGHCGVTLSPIYHLLLN